MRRPVQLTLFWTSVVSFVLCCALFAASVRWTAYFTTQFNDAIGIKSGGVILVWTSRTLREQRVQSWGVSLRREWEWRCVSRKTRVFWWPVAGYDHNVVGHSTVWFQFWPLILVSAASAALTYPRRRFGPGRCHSCGYRLDGLPDNTCPECGTTSTLAITP